MKASTTGAREKTGEGNKGHRAVVCLSHGGGEANSDFLGLGI